MKRGCILLIATSVASKSLPNITEFRPALQLATINTTLLTTETTITTNSTSTPNQTAKPTNYDVQWLPLTIVFVAIIALCISCNSKLCECKCCDCPSLNYRSDQINRYGSNPRQRKDRFQATSGYPYEPNVDAHQKYCGPNRLHRYKEPVIAIVDENDKILEDTYTLTNSYLNTADSKDEMRMFKYDLEEKRRMHQERTEMINNLSKTRREMAAIRETKEPVPVYTSRENIFNMWKAGIVEEDSWSIHAPPLQEEEKSQVEQKLLDCHECSQSRDSVAKIAGEDVESKESETETKSDEQIVVVSYEEIKRDHVLKYV